MPPYTPVTSKAQSRKLFQLVSIGKLSMAEAKGKTEAADWSKLPARASTAHVTRKPTSASTVASAPKVRGGHSHPIANLGKFAHMPRGRR